MDNERQQILDGGSRVGKVDRVLINLGTDEDELHHNQGHHVQDPPSVVVEKEQLGFVQDFSPLHESLMPGLDLILLCGKMLSKYLTVVIHLIFLTFLSYLRMLNPDDGRLLLIINLEQFYLFKKDLTFIGLIPATRNESVLIGLHDCHDHDVNHCS